MKQVLVVDDDDAALRLMVSILKNHGVPAILAGDHRAALDAISRGKDQIGLILLDIRLPDVDGFDLCRAIRADRRFAALPVVAITAWTMDNTATLASAAGMNGVIFKPFLPQQIYTLLDEHHLTHGE